MLSYDPEEYLTFNPSLDHRGTFILVISCFPTVFVRLQDILSAKLP